MREGLLGEKAALFPDLSWWRPFCSAQGREKALFLTFVEEVHVCAPISRAHRAIEEKEG